MGLEPVGADDVLEALIEVSKTERPDVLRCLPRPVLRKLAASGKGAAVAAAEYLARQGNARLESWGVPPDRIAELNDMFPPPPLYPDRGGPG